MVILNLKDIQDIFCCIETTIALLNSSRAALKGHAWYLFVSSWRHLWAAMPVLRAEENPIS